MFFQKPSSYAAQTEPRQKRISDVLLRLVIALNVLVLIIAVGYVAWMPGSEGGTTARAQDRGKLVSWDIPNLSAQSGSARQSDLAAAKKEAAASAPEAAPVAALLGGMTPTPGPTVPAVQPAPATNEIGGTCISGYIIDVYEQRRGEGFDVTVRKDETGSTPIKQRSDATGSYQFTGLTAGTYIVEISIPEGWREFTPATFKVTLSGEGNACARTRFKLEALACMQVFKLDESGNLVGNGMIGIPGWKMNASSGQINLLQETDGKGEAFFRNLIPGRWTVKEETRSGWMPATGYSDTTTLDLPSPLVPHSCQPVVFVNKQVHTGCIAPKKVRPDGTPVANWQFTVRSKNGTYAPRGPLTTDANGVAYFTDLPLGEWIVEEVVTADLRKMWRPVGPTTQEIKLDQANNLCTQPTFTNEPLASIIGYKINHLEEGLMGWEITAVNDTTGETLTTKTNINGYFEFIGLPLGTWTLSENLEQHPGWEAVTPSTFKVILDVPFEQEVIRFKNRTQTACLYVYKRDIFDNYGLAEWDILLQPAYSNNSADIRRARTDGTGLAIFEGLPPGEWKINEVMQDGWAPYDPNLFNTTLILEASGNCSTVTIYNQQTNRAPAPIVPFDPRTPTAPGPVNNTCSQYYTIVRGDTLTAIASRFGVTLEKLREVNKISNPNLIHPNTTLCIPR